MSRLKQRWLWLVASSASGLLLLIGVLWPTDERADAPVIPLPSRLRVPDNLPIAAALTAPAFASERLPPDIMNGSTAAAPTEATQMSSVPALVGVALRLRGAGVALVRGADGQTLVLKPGDVADGWTLVSVDRAGAVFRRGQEQKSASLEFSNKQSTQTPEASASSPTLPPAQGTAAPTG